MATKGIDALIDEGLNLLEGRDAISTHDDFIEWSDGVRRWLRRIYPDDPGLMAEWASLESSQLVTGGSYSNDPDDWYEFGTMVRSRMKWLGCLAEKTVKPKKVVNAYVAEIRIEELTQLPKGAFDTTKLVRFCEEINICYTEQCFLSVAMLMRAVLDHVPPVFRQENFRGVANNYNGGKSFKEQMQRLNEEMRKIADGHLHSQIRSSETLPSVMQVEFRSMLDALLSEIVRLLKAPSVASP